MNKNSVVCGPALCLCSLVLALSTPAWSQGLRSTNAPTGLAVRPAPDAAPVAGPRASDFIVAVVDAEPITNQELQSQVSQTLAQLQQQQGSFLPTKEQLMRQVLERLIDERTQLHWARESGVRVDEGGVEQAEQNMAAQSGLSLEQFRLRMAEQGISPAQFRAGLRDQITLQRLRDREVTGRIRVTDSEIDKYIAERETVDRNAEPLLSLGHILLAVPESSSEAETQVLRQKALDLIKQLRAGADFVQLAKQHSNAGDRAQGGVMGLRMAQRYPSLFTEATQKTKVGDLAELQQSGAGFHILKVLERKLPSSNALTLPQTLARHILIRPSAQNAPNTIRARLAEMKAQIESGRAEFATVARLNSQDGSASAGGDLGWANPGMFVPEFEEAMNRLAIGQISPPFQTRFGIHIIQVMDRRQAELGVKERREVARTALREQKFEDSYRAWSQEIRGRAYVEYREDPQ